MGRIYLSVIIPAYNEERSIRTGSLQSVWDHLSRQSYAWEVLVMDDGSTDKTLFLLKKFSEKHKGFRILEEPHRGKGGSVIAGMLKAEGEIILFTDMDQATPIRELEAVLPKFAQGCDVVIGSRSGREGAPFFRKLMAYGFSLLRLLVLGLPYKDTQCGFKAFKKGAAGKIFKRLRVFNESSVAKGAAVTAGFDLEVLYIARKLGLKVAEVPVVWHHKETERINALKDSWEGFRDLLRVRINALMGRYKT